jgi:hypothetical protein
MRLLKYQFRNSGTNRSAATATGTSLETTCDHLVFLAGGKLKHEIFGKSLSKTN